MFWKLAALSASSPVESVLDKENFTLEELLDEEEIIQECKALNSRVISFLRDRAQVEQLVRYIVEEPPEDTDSKRTFKFPFVPCEIFTCEIDVILKTLVEEEELMHLLFSFLEPNCPHTAFLAGYFSKVVVCLMIRKTTQLLNYVKAHQDVLQQLVDLIGITSIMEILVRLVDADDHLYPNSLDVMQWLTDSNLLKMIVDKLNTLENNEWSEWNTTILQERNLVENVHRWACGSPTALQERTRDSDEEDVQDRDYDITELANNLSQNFRYTIYDNDENEGHGGSFDRNDEVYFDDESTEVVISSLRLGDDHGSLFTNSNWFAFQDDRNGGDVPMNTSSSDMVDDINLNGIMNGGNSSSDDEVMVGEDEEMTESSRSSPNGSSSFQANGFDGFSVNNSMGDRDSSDTMDEKTAASNDLGFFRFESPDNNPFGDRLSHLNPSDVYSFNK
ncbi:uncharacterized protein LOC121795597 isoform X2 [Salvia splendens]|uniref:uncharacterized protein LOC121795597 isoform X2 n=1 Tax=Salvia splendens TaxID=180675 RepID=UPI001C26EE2C|nr:uncharacterized protein LOC121795597 isoform X2 [Salvia splendens]